MKRLQPTFLVRFSVEHPWIVILTAALITALSIIPITSLRVEADVETLLPRTSAEEELEDKPVSLTDYDRLAILARSNDLFTLEGLEQFSTLIEDLGEDLGAEEVIVPFDMITLESAGSRLRPTTMATGGKVPKNAQELADFTRRLDADPFSRGLISSRDGKGLTAYLLIPKGRPYLEQNAIIDNFTASAKDGLEFTVTGSTPFSAETERYLTRDFFRLMAFVIITILVSYYMGFRSRRAMILPVVLVMSGTAWSLGFMGLLGWKLSMVSIVSPPLVLTLGSSYSIHILSEYYRLPMTVSDKKERIIKAVTGVSGTIVMASLTTLTGLICLLLASMPQTRQFAISTSVGIIATAFLSLSVFPAFLSLQRPVAEAKVNQVKSDGLSRGLKRLGPMLVRRRWPSLLIFVSLLVVFVILIPQVQFNTNPTSYYPQDSHVIGELKKFSREVGGFDEINITLKAPDNEANYFLQPEVLDTIHFVENRIAEYPDISHLMSLPAYLSFASRVALGREGDFTNRGLNLLVSRMILSNGESGSASLANEELSEMNLKLRVFNESEGRSVDELDTKRIADELNRILKQNLPEGVTWEMEGLTLDFLELSEIMRRDFLVSTLAALVAIGLLCAVAFRSLRQGFLALVPLIAGIAATFILMTIFRIPLDMTTIMVSCVAIGVGVDDAIHFLLQHRRQMKQHPENPAAVARETLMLTGRPIVLTSLSIVLGLTWFVFAEFRPIVYFGLLIAITLTTACLATLFLLPPLAGRIHGEK